MREFERISALQRRFARERADIRLGMGDDAAVLAVSPREQVLTVDACV